MTTSFLRTSHVGALSGRHLKKRLKFYREEYLKKYIFKLFLTILNQTFCGSTLKVLHSFTTILSQTFYGPTLKITILNRYA
jgi:hypothetical protein